MAESLTGSVSGLLDELDGITSIGAMLRAGGVRVGADLPTRAQLRYLDGDHEAALADLRAASEFLSDRRGMSLGELIVRGRMFGLGPARGLLPASHLGLPHRTGDERPHALAHELLDLDGEDFRRAHLAVDELDHTPQFGRDLVGDEGHADAPG